MIGLVYVLIGYLIKKLFLYIWGNGMMHNAAEIVIYTFKNVGSWNLIHFGFHFYSFSCMILFYRLYSNVTSMREVHHNSSLMSKEICISYLDNTQRELKIISKGKERKKNIVRLSICVMLRIFIQDSLFSSQGELWSMRVLRRRS